MEIKDKLFRVIQFTWGIIQTAIGGVIFLIVKNMKLYTEIVKYKSSIITTLGRGWGGISLGCFIFISERASLKEREDVIKHEYGHSLQSIIFGPFYLLVIGIPSIVWNKFFRVYRQKHNISYYSFLPEKWADKLGKVVR